MVREPDVILCHINYYDDAVISAVASQREDVSFRPASFVRLSYVCLFQFPGVGGTLHRLFGGDDG